MTVPDSNFFPFRTDAETMAKVAANIREVMGDYVRRCNLKSLVLGISGGIDSALCAALLRPVCLEAGIPLIGRSITIETNKKVEIDRSIAVGETFCTDFTHVDLTDIFLYSKKMLERYDDSMLSKLRQGNMKRHRAHPQGRNHPSGQLRQRQECPHPAFQLHGRRHLLHG